jgi:hypothetical protein
MSLKANLASAWEKFRGWRTVAFGTALAAAPLLIEPLSQIGAMDLKPIFKDHAEGITTGIGVVIVVLRVLTVSGIGSNSTKVEG